MASRSGVFDRWRDIYAADTDDSDKPGPKSGNPSEYGYTYSVERPAPPPEAFWKEKVNGEEQPINLYSENVVKEVETTESVDRESIANLATTRQQWESKFVADPVSSGASVKSRAAPKWEVRLPYKEKPQAPDTPDTPNEQVPSFSSNDQIPATMDTESAIEREIRLAHEREEMLRKEKEERQLIMEKQKQLHQQQLEQQYQQQAVPKGSGQTIIASYEAASAESESCQPAFNELAEADQAPDLWSGRPQDVEEESGDEAQVLDPNESIIEREIRLQREREAELLRERQRVMGGSQPQRQQQQQQKQILGEASSHAPVPLIAHENMNQDINHNQRKSLSYEAAPQTQGESIIARELRELKEREEEMKKLRLSLNAAHLDSTEQSTHQPQQKPTSLGISQTYSQNSASTVSSSQATWQKDVSPYVNARRSSFDSSSSHSTGCTPSELPSKNIRVQPLSDGYADEDEKQDSPEIHETPIEREMRLARERENELRRIKGLPELTINANTDSYGSYGASSNNTQTVYSIPRSDGNTGKSMKKFASNRLSKELMQQKEREQALRNEGKIISTSEEHAQPLNKYMEVTGLDKVDGTAKRNFVTKRTSVSFASPPEEQPGPSRSLRSQSIPAAPVAKKGAKAAFSYKEFKQTAESKIERELREMREREEELRIQRSGDTPR